MFLNCLLGYSCGEIDVLIGTNYYEFLPRVIQTNQGLQLLENQFGLSIRGRNDDFTGEINTSQYIVVKRHKLSCYTKLNEVIIDLADDLKTKLNKFFIIEDIRMQWFTVY